MSVQAMLYEKGGEVITIDEDAGVQDAARLMRKPVLAADRLVGIVSMGDVVKHRLENLELEANVLRDAYIAAH